jgi:hypothetical protein
VNLANTGRVEGHGGRCVGRVLKADRKHWKGLNWCDIGFSTVAEQSPRHSMVRGSSPGTRYQVPGTGTGTDIGTGRGKTDKMFLWY